MDSLSFDSSTIFVGGKPTFLSSGEFHYFRVPKSDWRKRMLLLKEMGGNALATYIPWSVHEPNEGEFRFDLGDGVSDLTEFLELAAEIGLYVIVRPGPYSYSELHRGGLPDWLMRDYPEVLAKKRNGSNIGDSSISYINPLFLEKARAWYAKVCPIIARHTLAKGGAVAFVQLDNEITGIHVWNGDYDFNAAAMGFGAENGRYATWLRGKYKTLAAVNAAYAAEKSDFASFSPTDEPKEAGVAKVRWNEDYGYFYRATAVEYIRILADYARDEGIDCDFCINAANPWMNFSFRGLKEKFRENELLLGSDHYWSLRQTWQQNNPTPQFAVYILLSLETLRLMGYPPVCFEAQYGSMCEWPSTQGTDVKALSMIHVSGGARGQNGYIFTGGANPVIKGEHTEGATAKIYDYDAPVGAKNELRKSYFALKEFGDFIAANPELAADFSDTDCFVAMPWRSYNGAKQSFDPARAPSPPALAETTQRGLLSGLYAMGIQPEFVDLDKPLDASRRGIPLFVPCDGVMSEENQTRLVEYVKLGGSVIFMPVFPMLDENYAPCTIISGAFGATSGSADSGQMYDFGDGDETNTLESQNFAAGKIPAHAQIIGHNIFTKLPAGWVADFGKGKIAWLGVSTMAQRKPHFTMWREMFRAAGGKIRWTDDNLDVIKTRRITSRGTMVFLGNYTAAAQTVNASFDCRRLEQIEIPPMTTKTFYL